jgi:hypothetical protein
LSSSLSVPRPFLSPHGSPVPLAGTTPEVLGPSFSAIPEGPSEDDGSWRDPADGVPAISGRSSRGMRSTRRQLSRIREILSINGHRRDAGIAPCLPRVRVGRISPSDPPGAVSALWLGPFSPVPFDPLATLRASLPPRSFRYRGSPRGAVRLPSDPTSFPTREDRLPPIGTLSHQGEVSMSSREHRERTEPRRARKDRAGGRRTRRSPGQCFP